MDNCGCSLIDSPFLNESINPCIISNNLGCSHQVLSKTEEDDFFRINCDKQCPFECDRVEFDYRMSGNEVL